MAKNFSDVINEIMPLVSESDISTPFIIYRKPDDANGPWFAAYPYPADNVIESLKQHRESDPSAVSFFGSDFSKGSFASVYDTVLCNRLRVEFHSGKESGAYFDEADAKEALAMLNFFEDRISEFSHKLTDYLTTLDKPLAALVEMCPYNMTPDYDEPYNEDLAFDAIHYMENEVNDRLHSYPDERMPEPQYIDGWKQTQSVQIGRIEIVLAENPEMESPYLVCNRDSDGEAYHKSAFPGYVSAIKEFLTRQSTLIGVIEEERASRAERGVDGTMLTASHCLPDSDKSSYTGKLLIVKASELSPEFRYSDSQIIRCTHGNGARPDAKGTSVFGKELYSGASVVYGRHQILGIADEDRLPQWAKNKLDIERDSSVFKFGDYHFKPYRNFKYGETDRQLEGDSRLWKTDAQYAMRNMGCDLSFGKTHYNHENFYKAAKGSTADIFRCLEDNNLYVPCANKMFLYTEPSEKELRVAENKALREYGNVIDAAIQEGVEQKSVPYSLEVLDARFGKERTDELLATVALTSLRNDGRISDSRREWAKSVIGNADDLKTINIKSHPAHFDNLMMYATQRDKPEQAKSVPKVEKPDFLGKINDNKQKVERDKANADTPAKKKNRDGQEV